MCCDVKQSELDIFICNFILLLKILSQIKLVIKNYEYALLSDKIPRCSELYKKARQSRSCSR